MNPLSIIEWGWNGLPWFVQWGAIGFIAFTSIGGIWNLYTFTRSVAGKWAIPAMFSLVIPVGLWLFSFIARRPVVRTEDQYAHPDGDAPQPPRKKKRKTIFDAFRKRK